MSIQVFQDPGRKSLIEGLTTLGGIIEQHGERRREAQKGEAYKGTLESLLPGVSDPTQQTVLQSAIDMLEKNPRQYDIAQNVIQQMGGLSNITSTGKTQNMFENVYGLPPNVAEKYTQAYMNMDPGTRTQFINQLVEQRQRGTGPYAQQQVAGPETGIEPKVPGKPGDEFALPEQDKLGTFQGLTPSEKFKRQETLGKENLDLWADAQKRMETIESESKLIKRNIQINQADKLPSGAGRWNVYKGELIFPLLSKHPEAEEYVKNVNSFLKGAKDIFGSRITDFDLQAFKSMLPTLSNTKDGRSLILETMQIVNELEGLKKGALLKVYNKYGRRNIEPERAAELAKQMVAKEKAKLDRRYETIQERKELITGNKELLVAPSGEKFTIDKNEVDAELMKQYLDPKGRYRFKRVYD